MTRLRAGEGEAPVLFYQFFGHFYRLLPRVGKKIPVRKPKKWQTGKKSNRYFFIFLPVVTGNKMASAEVW